MRRVKGQAGMSLVEATIILLVLMLLTSVLAPSIFDYVHDAQLVKVKEDCEAIGLSVARLTRDVGPCLMRTYSAGGCTVENRVAILHSDGEPTVDGMIDLTTAPDFAPGDGTTTPLNWSDSRVGTVGDSMSNQFATNGPDYKTPGDYTPETWQSSGPVFVAGWRGAYLPDPIGPDPWGDEYLVNTIFLAVASNSTVAPSTSEGGRRGGWSHDVFCISAGVNRLFQTSFGSADASGNLTLGKRGTVKQGDDFIYVISGDTR